MTTSTPFSKDVRKDLPPADSPNFLPRVREVISTYLGARGDKLDRGITLRDLVDGGVVTPSETYLSGTAAPPIAGPTAKPYVVDLTPPPTPTGIVLSAAISHLLIQTDDPLFTQGNGYSRTNVYGVKVADAADTSKVFADAVLLTQFTGSVGSYSSDPAQGWRIWLTWETVDGVESPAPSGGATGDYVQTGQDVRKLLDAITAAAETTGAPFSRLALRGDLIYVTDGQGLNSAGLFSIVTTPITVGGVTVPAGVYLSDLFVMNGSITNAKIANAAIDDAKVANLSAAKLTAGSIAVGEYIQSLGFVSGASGWRIHGNGTAEFSAASIRGQLTSAQIAAGAIGTNQLSANAVTADKLSAINVQIGKYLSSASYSPGSSGWYIDGNGQAEFNNVTVRGNVYATNGYFSGVLAANIVNASNLSDGAVTSTKIVTGAVNTPKIAANSVVVPAFFTGYNGGSFSAGTNPVTVLSGYANFADTGNVVVNGYVQYSCPGDWTNIWVQFAVDGSVFFDISDTSQKGSSGSFAYAASVVVGAGTHYFEMRVGNNAGANYFTLNRFSMLIFGAMR